MWTSDGYPIENHAKGSQDANPSWKNWKRNRSGQLEFDQTEGNSEYFFSKKNSCKKWDFFFKIASGDWDESESGNAQEKYAIWRWIHGKLQQIDANRKDAHIPS